MSSKQDPEVKKTSTENPETPQVEVYKPTRIPKDGIVKAADLPLIADEFLKYVFPEESKQINADSKYGQHNSKTGKKEVSGYRSQYIINALNEIIGPGNWREYGTTETTLPATAFVSIYNGVLEIGNWHNDKRTVKKSKTLPDGSLETIETEEIDTWFEVLARFEQTG